MKDLKFRIWNGREFIYSDNIEYSSTPVLGKKAREKSESYLQLERLSLFFNPELWMKGLDLRSIECFIGFKDKADKEIYEGDVVEIGGLRYQVIWRDFKWIIQCPYYHKYHSPTYDLSCPQAARVSVVGNIHANPELLIKDV